MTDFMTHVVVDSEGHWLWYGPRSMGHDYYVLDGATMPARRAAVELFGRADVTCTLHGCVNPHHVQPRAGKYHGKWLDAAAVKLIRMKLAQGVDLDELAGHYGVSRGTIEDVRDRVTWRHV